MPEVTEADYLPELLELTRWDQGEWESFKWLPPSGKRIAIEAYRSAEWAKPADAWTRFVELLGMAAQVAGDVVGLGAAVTFARGL